MITLIVFNRSTYNYYYCVGGGGVGCCCSCCIYNSNHNHKCNSKENAPETQQKGIKKVLNFFCFDQ